MDEGSAAWSDRGENLLPVRARLGLFYTDNSASRVIDCNDTFLKVVGAVSREGVNHSDLVLHLLWLVQELRARAPQVGDSVEDELCFYEGRDEVLTRRLNVVVNRVSHNALLCLVRDVGRPLG